MPSPLSVPNAVYDEIIAHCQRHYPKEACGMLAGPTPASPPRAFQRLVTQVYPMRNVEESPIGYSMDPQEQLQVEKQMRQRHQHLLAIYHSHTATEAYPSSVDVSLAISPDISYVLVSLKNQQQPVFKSYRIDGVTVTEEPVRMEDAPSG